MVRTPSFAIAVAALVGAGCEFTAPGGPSEFPKAVVEGSVSLDGRPLPNGGVGWVTFFPEGAARGDVAVCRLNSDGSFRCDRVPVGPNHVRIDAAPSALATTPAIVRRRVQILRGPESPFRITTTAENVTRFDFDLLRTPDPAR
jgi:hypothetical protein